MNWIFWKVSDHDDELAWLGITRPSARSAVDRVKFWTLIPKRRFFIANWYVSEDHLRSPGGIWNYENIEIAEAREILKELPDVSPEDLARITRPQRILTLDQVDRITVLNVMGKNADAALWQRP